MFGRGRGRGHADEEARPQNVFRLVAENGVLLAGPPSAFGIECDTGLTALALKTERIKSGKISEVALVRLIAPGEDYLSAHGSSRTNGPKPLLIFYDPTRAGNRTRPFQENLGVFCAIHINLKKFPRERFITISTGAILGEAEQAIVVQWLATLGIKCGPDA